MPKFIPFKALRPREDLIAEVSAKSTDFNSQELLVDSLRNNALSFHHVTKNHLNYSGAFQEPEKFLPFASKFVHDMKEQGVLIKDVEPAFYIYEQTRNDGKQFKGIIGLTSVADYEANRIKKHEEIRPSRVKFMVELFKTTRVLGEPTLIAYKAPNPLPQPESEPIYEFSSTDGKAHKISRITDEDAKASIQRYFEGIRYFYIADGHHRSASAAEFRANYPEMDNAYCLSLLMDEDDLEINSFHRLIKGVKNLEKEVLLDKLSEFFTIYKSTESLITPALKGQFGLYLDYEWFLLKSKTKSSQMDVQLLEDLVVRNIYGIQDSRVDSQITFLPNTDRGEQLTSLVDSGAFDVAFTLKPCEFREIREIADKNEILPPKSTYIEPKLRAGMIIQEF